MKPKLFILIPTLRMGGAENVLINFLSLLDLNRYRVTLGVVLFDGPLIEKVPDEVKVIGLTRSELLIRAANFIYYKFGIRVLIKWLIRKLKGNYDVAICFQDSVFTDYILFSKIKYELSLSVVQSNYTTYKEKGKHFKGSHKNRVLERYRKLNRIVAVSNTVKVGFEQLYGPHDNITVSYNPINSRKVLELANLPLDISLDDDTINFIAIGRLVPVKGYCDLISAAVKLKNQNLNFKIRIIGTGPQKDELQKLITDENISHHVELLGFVENPYPIMKASDIYVMSSLSEGLPTALCEAMFLELPILSTDASGCKEVLDNGKYGFQVSREVDALADGIKALIQSPNLRKKYRLLSQERSKIFSDTNSMKFYRDRIEQSVK